MIRSIRMRPSSSALFIITCLALAVAACNSTRARFPVQRYVPVSRTMEPLGELDLSNTLMRLGALEGEMKLDYVGQMPESAGEDLVGASVYRVKNWEPFFKQNAGRNAYCTSAPRWVVVNSKTGAPSWSNEIWVGLLTLEEWEQYTPDEHRACAGGTYVRGQG
jgi:hypothetical protein